MQIPMSSPDVGEDGIAAVNAVLRTPFLSIGPRIEQFEATMARRAGSKHAIGVNSGTSGLQLCVIAAGVQSGDLVITTPFSFIASANVILYERGDFPVTECLGDVSLALPFSGVMTEGQVDRVCEVLRRVLRSGSGVAHTTVTHTAVVGARS